MNAPTVATNGLYRADTASSWWALMPALHVDYRYFSDDWGIDAHTVDIAWHQNVGGRTAIIPFLRYHTQDEADFFANSVDFSERYYADDYRLSAYGAVSLGLKLRHDIGNWRLNLAAERYQSNNEWGIYGGEESPALVDFWRTSIGLDYRFR